MAERSVERADELEARFAPLWTDIDAALAAPAEDKRDRLAAARARLEQARSRHGDVHTTSISIDPLGGQR
jgi:hypothetical protein